MCVGVSRMGRFRGGGQIWRDFVSDIMSKTKEEECLEACTEATKYDAEADDLPQGSAEKVGAIVVSCLCVLYERCAQKIRKSFNYPLRASKETSCLACSMKT